MKFLHGEALSTEIRRIVAEPGARCAVAFWGRGSESWLSDASGARIICNLKMGGTNPYSIKKLKLIAEVKQIDDLHAKVYLGRDTAIVTSANASANGLGFEGFDPARWREAGVLLTDIRAVEDWFEIQWQGARDISAEDLDFDPPPPPPPPSPPNFADFDVEAETLPLVVWFGGNDWIQDDPEIGIRQSDKVDYEPLQEMIDNGIRIEPGDGNILGKRGTWLLYWWPDKEALPRRSGSFKPGWKFLDGVRKGVMVKGEERADVALGRPDELVPAPPFDASEQRFIEALRVVLATPEYRDFIEPDYEAPWFRDRAARFPGFWRDVKSAYDKLPSDG